MSDAQGFRRRAPVTLAIALTVSAIVATLTLPGAMRGGALTPDSTEHLAIAHSWVQGAGFVDPVQWYWLLDVIPPIPATAARAPVVPMLAAIPLAFGATVSTVIVLHALWAGLICGLVFWVGSRFMRRRAAAAAALLLCVSFSWIELANSPLTEVTATAAYLLILVTARGLLESRPKALLCAALSLIAYLTRPQLAAMALAVVAAALIEIGPRRALRCVPLWTYALCFVVGIIAIGAAVEASTGLPLYAGYGHQYQVLSLDWSKGVISYGHAYEGTLNFIRNNTEAITAITGQRVVQSTRALSSSYFNYVGWIAVPAVLFGLFRRRDGVVAHRVNALAILGFFAVVIGTYSAFQPRYMMIVALPASLGGLAWLDTVLRGMESRSRVRAKRWRTQLTGYVPLIAVAVFFVILPWWRWPGSLPAAWAIYQEARTSAVPVADAEMRALCKSMHPDAIVASVQPWRVLAMCGNAGLRTPVDLGGPRSDLLDRFLQERKPEYLLLGPGSSSAFVKKLLAHGMRLVDKDSEVRLLVVENPPAGSRPWKAPPPLRCAGRPPACAALIGR